LGKEKMIPRFAEEALGQLLLKYFVYVRPTEEVFARQLWGEEAAKTMHHYIFYTYQAKPYHSTTQFSAILQRHTREHLAVALDVSTYRHVAAAIGRYLMVGMIDPEENLNTGMDLQAGRTTATSEMIYGLQSGEDGKLNERLMALFLAMSRLWHARVLRQKLDGRIATLKEILDPTTTDDQLGGQEHQANGDLTAIVSHLEAVFDQALVKNIIPQLVSFYKQQEVDRILAQDKSLMPTNHFSGPPNPISPGHFSPPITTINPASASPIKSKDKGKQRAAMEEDSVPAQSSERDMESEEAQALADAIEASIISKGLEHQAELAMHTSGYQSAIPPPVPTPNLPLAIPSLTQSKDYQQRLRTVLHDPHAEFMGDQCISFSLLIERQVHVLNVAPTGGGKTLPFQLAMKSWPSNVCGLMVLPYKVLHHDMHRRMREMTLTASEWTPYNPSPASRIITVSIEYFKDPKFLALINTMAQESRLGCIIFDEAHGLMEDSNWRRMYLGSLREILSYPNIVCHFLSATFPPSFMNDFWAMIGYKFHPKEAFAVLRTSTQRPNHFYQIMNLDIGWKEKGDQEWDRRWLAATVKQINQRVAFLSEEERGLVFLTGEEETRTWATALNCPAITGKTSGQDRNKAYQDWRQGTFKILCANKAGYYGTDYPNVSFSIHVDCPRALTEWAQSCGRVGRDGSPALCLMLLPRFMGQRKDPKPETFNGTNAIRDLVSKKQCRRIVPSTFLDGVPTTCSLLRKEEEFAAWCDMCLKEVPGALPTDAYVVLEGDGDEAWGWTEPSGWEVGFSSQTGDTEDITVIPKVLHKPVQLEQLELIPTSHILDVNQLLRRETTRVAMKVPDTVFRALEMMENYCLACLAKGIETRSHGTVRCGSFWDKQGGERYFSWKKRFFLAVGEEGYCYRCLFDADDERHVHKVGNGLGEHCRFEDVVGPLAWMVMWDSEMRKQLGEDIGDKRVEEQEPFLKWLLVRLDDNHRHSNACTRLVRWFYNRYKGMEMPTL
jgi:hypothetical protein